MALYFSAFCHLLLNIRAKFGLTFSPFSGFSLALGAQFSLSLGLLFNGKICHISRDAANLPAPYIGEFVLLFSKGFQRARDHSLHWIWSPSVAFYFSTFCQLFIFGPHLAALFRHFSGVSKAFGLEFRSARPPFWLISKGKICHISINTSNLPAPIWGEFFCNFFSRKRFQRDWAQFP